MLRRPLLSASSSPCCTPRLCAIRAPAPGRPFSATHPALARKRREKAAKARAAPDRATKSEKRERKKEEAPPQLSLKEAMLGAIKTKPTTKAPTNKLPIDTLDPADLEFQPIDIDSPPPVPMLAHGLDRVLFNPGVYHLQDPRSRVYNFDPYLEKIMPVNEFNFDTLSTYKTSSKDDTLLDMTRKLAVKYTGSTSSMSGVLQHFHFLLSAFRPLNHDVLSKAYPVSSSKFSRITTGPDAVFLRYKDGVYALDADKTYDTPNIMSWLGHSLEKLLTSERTDFERYRRSSDGETPSDDDSGRCFHYTRQGKILMRSQLDARDPRLPGTGVFDLKTRAVVSIRMNHTEYLEGTGYQLRYARGEWESFEREFYDMTRATLLKYSLQVRMGRMDGIFLAYHNIERIFGFQYLSIADMDQVIHGQHNTCLGDQEFKMSIDLLEQLMERATAKYPAQSIRFHFEARDAKAPFMYVFAEPVTEEEAETIQNRGVAEQHEFARRVVGLGNDSADAWQDLQSEVDSEVDQEKTEDAPQSHTEQDEAQRPLIGWTLTLRNKVNGDYVERPEGLRNDDSWKVEYHIKEIAENMSWKAYRATRDRRRQLLSNDTTTDSLAHYRDLIKRYTKRGRAWREKQDRISEEKGVEVYKPLGPGSANA